MERPLSDPELMFVTGELVAMLRTGVPIREGLEVLAGKGTPAGRVMRGVAEDVQAGSPLHEAFAKRPGFPPLFVALVKAGEASGTLVELLDRYHDYLGNREKLRKGVRRAVAYPAAVSGLAFGAILVLTVYVFPKIAALLEGSEAQLPLPARLALMGADVLARIGPLLLLGAAALVVSGKAASYTRAGAAAFSRVRHRLPGLRPIFENAALDTFFTTTGLILHSGAPIAAGMEVLAEAFRDDPLFANAAAAVARGLGEGRTLTESFRGAGVFPEQALKSIELAEKGGRLPAALESLGRRHRDDLEEATRRLLGRVEVGALLAVGLVVGAIVIGVYQALMVMAEASFH